MLRVNIGGLTAGPLPPIHELWRILDPHAREYNSLQSFERDVERRQFDSTDRITSRPRILVSMGYTADQFPEKTTVTLAHTLVEFRDAHFASDWITTSSMQSAKLHSELSLCAPRIRGTLAAAALGLDPGLGVLHVDTTARDSLALDILEPVRAQVDSYLLDLITREYLNRSWFLEERDGNCRLSADFVSRLAQTAPMWSRAVAPVGEWVAREFWKTIRRPDVPFATRLTQNNKREATGPTPVPPPIKLPRLDKLCPDCGKTIRPKSTKCASCAVDDATKNMLGAARIGRQTVNGPEAQAKRAIKGSKNALAQHSWKASDQPSWLTQELFQEKSQPLLANVSMSDVRSSIGVSKWYASKIRQGYRPHPRHWQALAKLVGVSDQS